jgi:transcription initiation factor TFIID subunit 6
VGIGKEAVRKGLVEGGGVKVVGSECMLGETGPLVDSVMVSISSHSCDHAN